MARITFSLLTALILCSLAAFALAQEQEVIVTPVDPPIEVYRGDNFRYDVTTINHADTTVRIDGWTGLTLPDGSHYGPLWKRYNVPFLGDSTVTFYNVFQRVPNYAYLGQYNFIFYIGDFPAITDSSYFDFTVIEGLAGESGGWDVHEWGEVEPVGASSSILSNYPNPFNATTDIHFFLNSDQAVNLEVYDILGRRVTALIENTFCEAGYHSIAWDASAHASGVYFYKLTAGENVFTKRMTLLK
ncbi:MAG: T9SS type A sorting domain-containing protein [candidate division Zixibacteria bacterium]|nr:T9SS type A sorting domain-containing protein [candidate division Zixibacteria bacterium]